MTRLEIAVRIAERMRSPLDHGPMDNFDAERLFEAINRPTHDASGRPQVMVAAAYAWRVAGDLIALALDADKQEGQKK